MVDLSAEHVQRALWMRAAHKQAQSPGKNLAVLQTYTLLSLYRTDSKLSASAALDALKSNATLLEKPIASAGEEGLLLFGNTAAGAAGVLLGGLPGVAITTAVSFGSTILAARIFAWCSPITRRSMRRLLRGLAATAGPVT